MTPAAGRYDGEAADQLTVLRELLSGGEILPEQLATTSHWSPGLSLAAAVLAQAMADIRLRRRDGRDHIQLASALRWVRATDVDWPLSFLRVCELLQLDAGWVRQTVNRWLSRATIAGRNTAYRHAA
jgi:hypothetical protein